MGGCQGNKESYWCRKGNDLQQHWRLLPREPPTQERLPTQSRKSASSMHCAQRFWEAEDAPAWRRRPPPSLCRSGPSAATSGGESRGRGRGKDRRGRRCCCVAGCVGSGSGAAATLGVPPVIPLLLITAPWCHHEPLVGSQGPSCCLGVLDELVLGAQRRDLGVRLTLGAGTALSPLLR